MGKLASKLTKRIMASLLTIAMIMSNMTVYASEYSESAVQTEDAVENAETDAAKLPSTEDEAVQDDMAQNEDTEDGTLSDDVSPEGSEEDGQDGIVSDSNSETENNSEEETESAPETELDAEEVSYDADTPTAREGEHTLWLVGDSTVCEFNDNYYYPRYGYGTQIGNYLNKSYTVNNLALSGRSSKSFLSESNYQTLKNGIQAGDVLVIGFGHNDEKAEADRYTNPNGDYQTDGSFAKCLYDNYVKIAKEKGAEVILCTPIVRRSANDTLSDSNCHITNDATAGGVAYPGGDYPKAIRDLGKAVNVDVVDMTALTKALYEEIGAAETLNLHAWTSNKPTSVDSTHLNIYGAKKVAWLFAKAVKDMDSLALSSAIDLTAGEPTKEKDLESNSKYVPPVYTVPTSGSAIFDKYTVGEGTGAVDFQATVFGDVGGQSKISKDNFTFGSDENGNMHIVAKGQGKIAAASDGIAMYYYKIPSGKKFKLSAKATLNSIGDHTQLAFGLMARDDMYIDKNDNSILSDYVVAGSLGKGSNCYYRKDGQLGGQGALTTEVIKADSAYNLSIEYNGDGYACTFGNEPTQSGGYDFQLTSVDPENVYIGMFVARQADVSYSNIYLEIDGKVVLDSRKTEYTVNVTSDENGTAVANKKNAAEGETVTLTATPNDGYMLDHWEASTASGTNINVVKNTFTMPAENVTVKAVFAKSVFDTKTVSKGTKDFTPNSGLELTSFEGITFANFEVDNKGHGFHSLGSGNPTMNLHMEAGKTASITVLTCCYGAGGGGTDPVTSSLSTSSGVVTNKEVDEGSLKGIQYNVLKVEDEYVTLTFANNMWIHNIMVEYQAEVSGDRKIDVWDFGAKEETNAELYNNKITYIEWLAYKDSIGSDGKFTKAGDYSFGDVTITGVLANDRLYSNVPELAGMIAGATNYADKSVADDDYASAGVYYCNGTGGASRRLITIENVQAGDKIVLYMGNTSSGNSDTVHFAGQGAAGDQDDTFTLSETIQKQEFVAKYTGTYKIYAAASGSAKPIYYRVMRLPGVEVSGTINLNGVELPEGYSLMFVNQTTYGETVANLNKNANGEITFSASLAPGYTYKAALSGATGYGFTTASAIVNVNNEEIITGKSGVNLVVEKKETYNFSGKIEGFASDYAKLNDLKIIMTPPATSSDDRVELNITKAEDGNITFDSILSPDVEYSLVMEGVNDYEIISPKFLKKSADDNGTSYENTVINVKTKAKYNVSGGFMGISGGTEVKELAFTNVADDYIYKAEINGYKDGYSIELRDGEYLAQATVENYSTKTHVVVNGGAVSKDLMFVSTVEKAKIDYVSDIYVGYPNQSNNYATVSEAMEACNLMTRKADERITVHIAPGTYREQIMVKAPNVSFVNDSDEEVLLTWYYGIGYKYYSASGGGNSYYDAEKAYDKYEKNIASKWGTAVYVQSTATAFRAEGITFENSFNRYVTEEELADGVEVAGNESISFVRNLRSDVTSKAATERATAIAIEAGQAEFKDCSFYSSQDTLYTAGSAYFKNCIIEGQTDYIFGSGNCVFDACELSWKGYSIGSQGGYITANRPASGDLGYLFRNCTVTANAHNSLEVKEGYWGRPWGQDATVKFMNTKLQSANLIIAAGWTSMSGATPEKAKFKEYNTTTMDGTAVNTASRVTGTIMTDVEAAAVDAKSYFGTWTPVYYTDDSDSTVEIQGDLTISDNGDINYVLPGHTLTVGYTLNSDANNENDASVVSWYTVEYTNGTAGTPKLVKTANGAIDKTYKVSKTDIGSYIKVTVTPGTVSGKTGTMKELTLYKDGDIDHIVNDGYYDPSTGSSSSLGDGVNVFLAGDSTTKDYSENGMYNNGKADNLGSWGEFFQCFFDESEVTIQNYANGGRSTRSFINDGSFDKIKAQIGAGDYLFIQFAHNDSSAIASKKDVYVPLGEPDADGIYPYTAGTKGSNGKYPDYAASAGSNESDNGTATYKWFLQQYIDMALEAGATPVLLTPVARMYVDDKNGNMKDHHKDEGSVKQEPFGYCKAVEQVYNDNKDKGVLFIDAYTITSDFYTKAWNETDKNTRNKQVMCLGDSTHSNKLGGMLTAAAYARELQNMNITISQAVKAPSKVSALTVADVSNGIDAGNPVFNIDENGNFTAYDLTKNCSERATYWEEIGTTMFTAIKAKADDLGSATEEGAVATPTATPDPSAGDVESGTTVTLNCDTEGAKIYYTTDGSNPKASKTSAEYVSGTTKITLTEDTTIKAIATKADMKDSKIAVFKYTLAPLVKAPTANIESGTVVGAGTKIELTTETTTKDVQIRYTMGANPAEPTKYSTRYDSKTGIVITSNTTIKAIAVVNDNVSAVSTFTYTVLSAPTFSPEPTNWKKGTPITLKAEDADEIRYTTDGTIPTASTGTVYEDAINIETTTTIIAISVKDGICSAPITCTYTVINTEIETLPSPRASQNGGTYTDAITVELTVEPSDASIFYTLDGSEPNRYSNLYERAISINKTTTLKAFAVKDGYNDSVTATYVYTIKSEGSSGSDITIGKDDGIEIKGLSKTYPYTGAKITPDFSVVDNGISEGGKARELTLGVDYTVKYANNSKLTSVTKKSATVTVIGKGNYVGKTVTESFDIVEDNKITDETKLSDLKGAKLDKIVPQDYTGEEIHPNFKLTLKGSKSPVEYKYVSGQYVKAADETEADVNVAVSNNINKGTATILVTGKKDAKGKVTSVKTTFKINAIDLSKADKNTLSVTVVPSSVSYAVKGATPKVEVSYKFSADKEVKLVNGKDYTLKYSANKKVGKGKFTITGKGNYTKKYTGTSEFDIAKLNMADTKLVAVDVYDGLKAGKVKATVVDENDDVLKASQYTVEVLKNATDTQAMDKNTKLQAGDTIYVRAKAKDTTNLEAETATVQFTVGKNIAKAKFTLTATGKSKPYTGAEVKLDVTKDLTVTIKENKQTINLKPKDSDNNGDYEIISYSNNVDKGTATVVIRGINDYSGTKTIKFKITAKTMKKYTPPTS